MITLKKKFFEIFIRSGERAEQNIIRPANKRMLTNRLGRVGGIVIEKTRRGWIQPENITYQVEDLNGCPSVWVKL